MPLAFGQTERVPVRAQLVSDIAGITAQQFTQGERTMRHEWMHTHTHTEDTVTLVL